MRLKKLFVAVMVAGSMAMPSIYTSLPAAGYASAFAGEGDMAELQLILKKLRASMESMKDFDELEKAGMSKKDVNRMRRAMKNKIEQMTDDAIASINAL